MSSLSSVWKLLKLVMDGFKLLDMNEYDWDEHVNQCVIIKISFQVFFQWMNDLFWSVNDSCRRLQVDWGSFHTDDYSNIISQVERKFEISFVLNRTSE